MKRCKHENVTLVLDIDAIGWRPVTKRQCLCGAWLSMGPSNDDSEAVAIEIRAARLAGNPRVSIEQWPTEMVGQEPHGWLAHKHDDDPIDPHHTFCSGWLARQIATHDDTQGGET